MPARTELRDLAGLAVMVNVESDELGYLIDWHLASIPSRTGSHLTSASLKLTIRRAETPPRPSDSGQLAHPKRVGKMTVQIGEALLAEHDAGGSVSADANGAVLTIWSRRKDEWLVFRQLMFLALTHCLSFHGRVVLHGALVSRGDRGLLILGGTGQGKSTFALASFLAGDHVHADDMTVAMLTETGHRLWGVPKRLTVPSEARELVSGLEAVEQLEPVPGDPRKRLFLPATALTNDVVEDIRVVVAGHHDGNGAVTMLNAQDTLEHVVASFEFADEPSMLHRTFGTLVCIGSTPGYLARHGVAPASRLDVARKLLDACYSDDEPSVG